MTAPHVIAELRSGTLHIAINRPERMNALHAASGDALIDALARAGRDRAVRSVLLRGVGRAFCSGADMGVSPEESVGVERMNQVVRSMLALPKPIVAAVRGPAAGVGCAVALAADVLVMSEASYLMLAFTKVGLMPDGGASALVAASAGRHRALRLALQAERLGADEALAAGLASEVVADELLDQRAESIADTFAAGPVLAYGKTKLAINAATLGDIEAALERELTGQTELIASADFEEGRRAFLEKRPAVFRGE